jgi:hypothetical protein
MELPRVSYGRRGNKRFNYKPRFYDEDKEDLYNRVEQSLAEKTGNFSAEGSKQRLQAAFKNRSSQAIDPAAQQQKLASRIRFILIALILGSMAYLVFYTNAFSIIFEAFK